MKADEIRLLYDYNYWADWRILTMCAQVSQDQYVADTNFGNLRATLVHTLDAEWSWRLGFQTHFVPIDSPRTDEAKMFDQSELTVADLPTLDALKERWQVEEREMRAYLGSLKDQDLNGLLRYRISEEHVRERVLWHCLIHLVNHGTQHRSEAAALLTSYGQSPGGMDFTVFLNEHLHLPG